MNFFYPLLIFIFALSTVSCTTTENVLVSQEPVLNLKQEQQQVHDLTLSDAIQAQLQAWKKSPQKSAISKRNLDRINTFYESNLFSPLWVTETKLTKAGETLRQIILSIEKEGLLPNDYHGEALHDLGLLKQEQVELILSDAFLLLTSHLQFGKVNPETLAVDWKLKKTQLDTLPLLSEVRPSQSIDTLISGVRTTQPRYYRLIDAYEKLLPYKNDFMQIIPVKPLIKKGSTDLRIPEIRKRLLFWGDLTTDNDSSRFDDDLFDAVKRFQYRHGLTNDGVLGEKTLRELNVSVADRLKDIVVNLERWRWLDKNMGDRFMVVNIANYDLRIFQNNEVVFQKPVIVGRHYRKTPVFSDRIRFLVLNPTWTVPKKIAIEDKLPDIKKDPDYFNRLGFTLYPAGTQNPIDPSSIDWSMYKDTFPFKMVQGPGPMNALGQVKFMFPNSYDVYIHDTPARDLFNQPERAFSSGCIRLSDPLELVEYLLKDQGWNREKIDAVLASRQTQSITLKAPMPIHIEYWTTWIDKSNTLHFRPDIYERNAELWQALQQPLKTNK